LVKIRLRRTGSRNQPSYRVVVAEASSPRDGGFIETIGHYGPLRNPALVEIEEDKALHWLRQGAQPTETVRGLMKKLGIWRKFQSAESASG